MSIFYKFFLDKKSQSSTLLSGGLLRTFGDEVRGGSELKNSGKYIDKGTQTNVNKLDTESKNEFDTGVPETPDTIVGVIDSYSKSHWYEKVTGKESDKY